MKASAAVRVGPGPRQQNAGHDDDQRIEKVEGAVDAAGGVNHQGDQGQIGKHLQQRLDAVFLPEGQQQEVKNGNRVPQQDDVDEQPQRESELGVSWAMASSMPSRQCQNDDADLDQPGQPQPLIEHGLHFCSL